MPSASSASTQADARSSALLPLPSRLTGVGTSSGAGVRVRAKRGSGKLRCVGHIAAALLLRALSLVGGENRVVRRFGWLGVRGLHADIRHGFVRQKRWPRWRSTALAWALASDRSPLSRPIPSGALLAELDRPRAGEIAGGSLPGSAQAFRTVADANAERQAKRMLAARAQKEAEKPRAAARPCDGRGREQAATEMAAKQAAEAVPDPGRQIYLNEAKARIDAALAAEIGFAERLVWFWSNHFCISADKIQSMSGAYEREAIRPHILGRFADMLQAVEGHPAMLFYLDNTASMGPNSIAGINRTRGLNENLAREILELHTLGVRTGYTQDDVISFAKVLTGWTFAPGRRQSRARRRVHVQSAPARAGAADGPWARSTRTPASSRGAPCCAIWPRTPRPRRTCGHQAGAALHCRRSAAGAGREAGERRSATRRGDLKEVAKALVPSPEAWALPRSKLKRPSEWVIAMVRAAGTHGRSRPLHRRAGEPRRAIVAPAVAPRLRRRRGDLDRRHGPAPGHRQHLRRADRRPASIPASSWTAVLGSTVSAETSQAVARAESRQQALALLFMSAEFQRR